jgi:hypothetical protein
MSRKSLKIILKKEFRKKKIFATNQSQLNELSPAKPIKYTIDLASTSLKNQLLKKRVQKKKLQPTTESAQQTLVQPSP